MKIVKIGVGAGLGAGLGYFVGPRIRGMFIKHDPKCLPEADNIVKARNRKITIWSAVAGAALGALR